MRKKLLVVAIMLMMTAALILAFTGAQWNNMTPVSGNLLTTGNIAATVVEGDSPINCNNMYPGLSKDFLIKVTPSGSINQDIWVGLDNVDNGGFDFVHYVDNNGVYNYAQDGYFSVAWDVNNDGSWEYGANIHDLFLNWREMVATVAPGAPIYVRIRITMDPSAPNYLQNRWANFVVDFNAFQAGATGPVGIPDHSEH